MGGALLEEPPVEGQDLKFVGSTIIAQAATREEVVEHLKADIYAKSGVWDVEKVSRLPSWNDERGKVVKGGQRD
jgi:uncharacterized protein